MARNGTHYLDADGLTEANVPNELSSSPAHSVQPNAPGLQLSDWSAVGARSFRGPWRDKDEGFRKSLLALCKAIKHEHNFNYLSTFDLPGNLPSEMRAVIRATIVLLGNRGAIQWMQNKRSEDASCCIELLVLIIKLTPAGSPLQQRAEVTLAELCSCSGRLPESFVKAFTTVTTVGERPAAHGGFADVWRGRYKKQRVALKVLRLSESDDFWRLLLQKAFVREMLHWKILRHPNVLPFLGVMSSPQFTFCMMSPWMGNGDILQYLNKPDMKNANRLECLLEIASGLQYLHRMQVVHGDLKSANILVDSTGRACLVDFGLAAVLRSLTKSQAISITYTGKGTTRWMPPELFEPRRFGASHGLNMKEGDVYALGMVMLEIFTGRIPFHDISDVQVIHEVINGHRPERPMDATHLGLSDSIWHLMEGCWQERYKDRPDIATAVSVITNEMRGAENR